MTPEQEQQVKDHRNLAMWAVNNHPLRNSRFHDEIESSAMEALCRAVISYCPEHECSLRTWILMKVHWGILDELRSFKDVRRKHNFAIISLDALLQAYKDHEPGVMLPPIGVEDLSSLETSEWVNWALASLPPKLHTLATEMWIEGRILRACGEDRGLTESRMCQLMRQVEDIVRKRVMQAA